jgi:hypothetical protein
VQEVVRIMMGREGKGGRTKNAGPSSTSTRAIHASFQHAWLFTLVFTMDGSACPLSNLLLPPALQVTHAPLGDSVLSSGLPSKTTKGSMSKLRRRWFAVIKGPFWGFEGPFLYAFLEMTVEAAGG